jgi:hypothetical protein
MRLTWHMTDKGSAVRAAFPQGTVWALVSCPSPGMGVLEVYEEECALAAARDVTEIIVLGSSREERAARNRFGVRAMLGLLRQIRSDLAEVRVWVYERVGGARPGCARTRR